ncbi:sugar ABC transporter ATP-binding protein [Breznakiella homolactica]|uniref:Sugar ABC transporter ATP-binding protein n=1 Tax=Breznakiella homolactica TaxID=2798577 RepID=A0A7T7XQE2_9SPIR|nr:sugar ABC transporter ATP-binding protein [Breznakiella homolactica]QQO10587.1 sugar ABC transporter ATP-binding protein [Breznakiella homolactica]
MGKAIEFSHVSKQFPGVKALKDVSFSVAQGEVHALLGENGAGKSTLLNILHGVQTDYEGDIFLSGEPVNFRNPHDAIIRGRISKVHQEINVVRDLTVGQNVTLGYEMVRAGLFVDYRKVNKTVNEILGKLNCDFRAEEMVSSLTAGQMQMLEIAKALFHNSRIISMDEPTSSLTEKETSSLFNIIGELKKSGITVIYVSHRLDEIFQICDRATILRDGEYIATLDVASTSKDELIKMMVGRNVSSIAARTIDCVQDEVVLKVEGLSRSQHYEDISFELKKGEILGFFGLVGAGRTEVMRTIFGADKKTAGSVFIKGKPANIRNTRDALKLGLGLLPEERKSQGFISFTSNADNTALSSLQKYLTYGFVDTRKKYENYSRIADEIKINPRQPDFLTQNMSGGNQQKVILARWLSTDADILIFDEPTKGIDVAAKMEIYRLMESLLKEGKSIIVVSSELPEITGISDRIIVFHEGRKMVELSKPQFDEQTILNYAMGELNT